jgi:hypothetical protein
MAWSLPFLKTGKLTIPPELRPVAEIWTNSGPGSYGSGYHLGGGLVLTAAHVIKVKGEDPPTVIKVRPLSLIASHPHQLLEADLVWPEMQKIGAEDLPDAALVKIRNAAVLITGKMRARIGPPDPLQKVLVVEVSACGFPSFRGSGRAQRDTEQINGQVRIGTRMLEGRYEIEDMTVRDRPLNDRLKWNGISGSALLDRRGQVVGILVARQAEGERYDFSAERIENLLAIDEFRNQVRPHAEIEYFSDEDDNSDELRRRPDLGKLLCLLGHDRQEGELRGYHNRAVSEDALPSSRSLVCLLPGAEESRHCPDDLSTRFAIKTLPDLRWPRNLVFQWLAWEPSSHFSVDVNLQRLREEFWSLLAPPIDSAAPEDAGPYRDLLKNGSRPCLFLTDLSRLGHEELDEVLDRWVPFWAALSPLPDGRLPIHLMMLNAQDAHAILVRLNGVPAGNVVIAPFSPLKKCTRSELKLWLEQRLPARLSQSDQTWLKPIGTKLLADFGAADFYRHDMQKALAVETADA